MLPNKISGVPSEDGAVSARMEDPLQEGRLSSESHSDAGGKDGKYRLLAELGRGGMANVYLAVARGPSGFNKLVVLKCLRSDLADDKELLTMFLEETRVAARVNHPHVVQTYEVGDHAGRPVIVMEYLEGQTLSSLVQRAKATSRLPLALHLRVLADALDGLHHAHELADFSGKRLDLVHRDVSPQNIFVTFDGQVKVLDFGIAKVANSQTQTSRGVLKGKIHYMAPEQMLCTPVDRRADLYAAGVMAWEAATGKRMWKDFTELQLMNKVTNDGAPLPREVDPTVSPVLEAIIMKALARNPDDRYATALEFAGAIESFMEQTGTVASNRGLAKLMRELFEDARKETRAIIEAQLLEVGSTESPARDDERLTASTSRRRNHFQPPP
jgi:eukaryotic-like serine/threonine-protein kinase